MEFWGEHFRWFSACWWNLDPERIAQRFNHVEGLFYSRPQDHLDAKTRVPDGIILTLGAKRRGSTRLRVTRQFQRSPRPRWTSDLKSLPSV